MLISYKYKFIFVHIYKTAGTSISYCLLPYARVLDRIVYDYRLTRKGFGLLNDLLGWHDKGNKYFTGYHKHATALEIKSKMSSRCYSSLYKFAFVRNPWDWRVSLYYYIQRSIKHKDYHVVSKMEFPEFIEWDISRKPQTLSDFIIDEKGEIVVDYIGKYEDLESDLRCIYKQLSLPDRKNIPRMNVSENRRRTYSSLYDSKSKKIVEDYFQEDIKRFGYTFE